MKKILFKIIVPLLLCLFIKCEQEVISDPPEVPAIRNSKVIVNSNPQGAKIYLDGKNMGLITPDSLSWLVPGSHNVTLKLGAFQDKSQTFVVQDSSRFFYSYDYYADPGNYGAIACSSTPTGANVFLNDLPLNQKTPLTLNKLFVDSYKVKVSFPFCRSDSIFINVRGGDTHNVSFILEDTTIWVTYKMANSPVISDHVTTIYIDRYGRRWFGSRDGGLFLFYRNKWTIYNKGYTVREILIDDQDNIWVATAGGLQFYNSLDGKWYDYKKYLPSTNVTSLYIDSYKNVWVGTTGGLAVYDGTSWNLITTSTEAGPLINNVVTCITEDSMKKLWIGTLGGINVIFNHVWYYYTTLEMNLPAAIGNGIQDIQADQDGIVWIAHLQNLDAKETGGLSKYDGQNFSVVNINGFTTNRINKISVDKNNYKWLSTYTGLGRFKLPNDLFTLTTYNSKIPAMQVTGALIDKNDDLWIATFGGGLAKLKKGNF